MQFCTSQVGEGSTTVHFPDVAPDILRISVVSKEERAVGPFDDTPAWPRRQPHSRVSFLSLYHSATDKVVLYRDTGSVYPGSGPIIGSVSGSEIHILGIAHAKDTFFQGWVGSAIQIQDTGSVSKELQNVSLVYGKSIFS